MIREKSPQHFRHLVQSENESVADFIHRLERSFRKAYGNDKMLSETRNALLFAQMQEGLKYGLMVGPAVSGAVRYQSLCVAAKSEERRQGALSRRQQYFRSKQWTPQGLTKSSSRHVGDGARRGRLIVYEVMCADVGIVVGLVIFPKTAVNHGERVLGNLDQCLPSPALLLKLFDQADTDSVEDPL